MLRSYNLLMRELERLLKPLDLTLSRFEVLLLLSFTRGRALPVMRLRDLLMIHGSSATYLVDRLVEAGWVAREADPGDRRVSIVRLTEAGGRMVEAGVAALAGAGFGPIAALAEDDRRALSSLLAAPARRPAPGAGNGDAARGQRAIVMPAASRSKVSGGDALVAQLDLLDALGGGLRAARPRSGCSAAP